MTLVTSAPPSPSRLARYELLRCLASGGMAEVHLARALGTAGFEKYVVVKRILPELARDGRFVQMFLDEARLASRLNHANVVQVFDAQEVDGTIFYVMEFLHGHDVRDMMRRASQTGTAIPLDQAIAIIMGVCAGLHHAHELRDDSGRPLGIVHRDVSPHNVFLTFDGNVKVIDFGIAKAASNLQVTASGVLKGKFSYMSPEQCRCRELDRRSDVFSIGVLLYELTTGRRLFPGDNDYDILKSVVEGSPTPPSLVDPAYPARLEAIVMKALRHDPARRYDTAQDMLHEIEVFARAEGLDLSSLSLGRLLQRLFPQVDEEPTLADPPPRAEATTTVKTPTDVVSPISGSMVTLTVPSPMTRVRRQNRRWVLGVSASGLLAAVLAVGVVVGRPAAAPTPEIEPSTAAAAAPALTVTPLLERPAPSTSAEPAPRSTAVAPAPPSVVIPPPSAAAKGSKPPRKVTSRATSPAAPSRPAAIPPPVSSRAILDAPLPQ